MSFSQRKNRKLQWVVTRVDNGNLHRPRPAYYGPLEEDSSDMDPSDLENTSPRIQGYQGMPPTSPGVQNRMNSEPISPRAMAHNMWTAALPQEREENIARRKQMQDIQSQMSHMKRQLDLLEAQYRELEAQESKELQTQSIQASGVGAQVISQFNSPGEAREARSVPPLNPRNLEDYADNSNEAINRYVQQSPLEDPNPLLFISRQDGTKAGQADRRASGQETGADTVSMLSPPETVASPPGENPPGSGGPNGQEVQKQPIQAVQPYARPRAPLQPYPPPIQPARAPTNAPGACKVAKGPVEKIYRCGHPGCKSTFARNCELRKHRKRHTRPYGCTARYCQRLFGSKNDWKRHENSQHHRLESWKCNVPVHPHGAGDICKAIHYRKENFVNHLKSSAHGIRTEAEIKRWAERSYIGGSDHHIFWCGFCVDESGVQGKTINLKKQGLAGWDERFNHLGSHFEQGCSIKQYKYQDEDAVHDCPSLSDSDDDDESAILPDPLESSPSLLQLANAAATIIHSSPANPTANPEENLAPVNVQSNPSNPSKRARSDKTWYCCKCLRNTGFSHVSLVDLQPSCLDCEHALCNECRQEQANQAEPSASGAPARSSTRRKRQ
ncbi:hypothetical protein BDD12DRAFT_831333 [Trichophaea hybrida]|nr:hypothetical protein BDD12DRAFT_831333 [Trichophaea hybrida]